MSASAISGVRGERFASISALLRMSFSVQIARSAWPCIEAAVPAPVWWLLVSSLFSVCVLAYHVQCVEAGG